ncbi:MAG: stage 0 sporulation family protein [Anaerococcus sp.]|nr:stage 0 sporulation family protein [Anaerococcus sp.]
MMVVGIRFRQAGKIYYFDANNMDFAYNDLVIVETSNGLELAQVAKPLIDTSKEEIKGKLSPVLRKANRDDLKQNKINKKEAKDAIETCQQKARDHGLRMKIIDAKYSFDRSKITFYFKAENRVDFRSLVKDLASIYRNRIELRQVGVRDHAKMIDHYGSCGQKCCCSRFLKDFKPLSIKMAKDQDITLDPTKISGMCGRLMCCLSYEEKNYQLAKKNMPKEGQRVETCDGSGVVLANDYVRESCRVRVRLLENDEELEKSYCLDDLIYKK